MPTNKIQINRVTNANVYLNGINMLGRALQVDCPPINATMAEHKGLGMLSAIDYFSGLDKMTCKIQWNSFYREALKAVSNPFQALNLQVRSSIENYENSSQVGRKPLVIFLRGNCTDFPTGSFKPNDNVELESNIKITAIRMEIDGEEIVNVDTEAMIWKSFGVDLLAEYRANLGID